MAKLFVSESSKAEQYKEDYSKALKLFAWQFKHDTELSEVKDYLEADYIICTFSDYYYYSLIAKSNKDYMNKLVRTVDNKYYVLFDSDTDFETAMTYIKPNKPYKWIWRTEDGTGYEVTSLGDRRFSPFFMKIEKDGKLITLEQYYHLYLKGYIEQGYSVDEWYKLKGMPPLHPERMKGTAHITYKDYLNEYRGLWFELAVIGQLYKFSDAFDKFGGQNKIYSDLLNEYYDLTNDEAKE